tara:strand:- start:674 stop:1702 length:1029 start_codon:yes stop_codon:yes gene_type:complete
MRIFLAATIGALLAVSLLMYVDPADPYVHAQTNVRGIPFHGFFPFATVQGDAFFVDSGHANASDNNDCRSPNTPCSSIEGTFNKGELTASNGEIVIVMQGHVETVSAAAGLDLDVAGVTLIGLGEGNNRPQINFTTAVGADMDVDAANITMYNFRFTGGIDALTGPIDVNAARFSLHNSLWEDSTGQVVDCIVADANADEMTISSLIPGRYGWKHLGSASAGTQSAIQVIGASNVIIQDFWIKGNLAIGGIENVTTAMVDYTIGGGIMPWYIQTLHANDIVIANVSTATGAIIGPGHARLKDDASNITEAIQLGDGGLFQPVSIVNADSQSSIDSNITASAD